MLQGRKRRFVVAFAGSSTGLDFCTSCRKINIFLSQKHATFLSLHRHFQAFTSRFRKAFSGSTLDKFLAYHFLLATRASRRGKWLDDHIFPWYRALVDPFRLSVIYLKGSLSGTFRLGFFHGGTTFSLVMVSCISWLRRRSIC